LLEEIGSAIKMNVKKSRVKNVGAVESYQNNDYTLSNNKGSTFWMSLNDFTKYFYIMTICYANNRYRQSFVQD
jgi:hypothetical protein